MIDQLEYYAGIGSRETPEQVLVEMTLLAEILRANGFILNSGGADGADDAFEHGARDDKQIFLPYDGFNKRKVDGVKFLIPNNPRAAKLAEHYHPAWNRCTFAAKRFHTRNVHQVLGLDLKTPVKFVVCYTERGLLKGGTAQAMRIAKDHDIPIFNFGSMTLNDIIYQLTIRGFIK